MPTIVSNRAPGTARTVAAPPAGWTIRSRSPWITRVAARSEEARVARGEDACQLPGDTVGRGIAIPGDARLLAHPPLVERKSTRGDVTEGAHRALGLVSPFGHRRHPLVGAPSPEVLDQTRLADTRLSGSRHDRGERAHRRMMRGDGLGDHSAHRGLRRSAHRGTRARPADRRCRGPCRWVAWRCRCRRAGSPTVWASESSHGWTGRHRDCRTGSPDIPARRGWPPSPPARCASAVPARRQARPAVPASSPNVS
jgi:hypothetical protein